MVGTIGRVSLKPIALETDIRKTQYYMVERIKGITWL